ncbi:threonine dehydratase [Kribbella aluminosa]|uniref:Threonine dehydratase n=1 Tax=Kribbella aluminosa TaxID=416017 RepID=A0ABS4UTN7_9ACTN|nr:pyridoxal-phosphate dependent enzyme [Kribbella aluminosa]MBP2354997.1 threonine dehydratase [Kribbella aluminosa]
MREILAAERRISPFVRKTPLWPARVRTVDGERDVLLKLEHLQVSGTFKARGAYNAVIRMARESSRSGPKRFVIASGGNAGIAAAVACKSLDVALTVVVPTWASPSRLAQLGQLGVEVVAQGETHAETHEIAGTIADRTKAVMLHPYNSVDAVAGAGTVALDLVKQSPGHGPIVVAVGGGGLLAGVALAGEYLGYETVGVEPTGAPSFNRALRAGAPVDVEVDTLAADTLGAARIGSLAFEICHQNPDVTSVLVDDKAIEMAREYLWQDFKLAVEPSAGAAFAAVMGGLVRSASDAPPVVILCGANALSVQTAMTVEG